MHLVSGFLIAYLMVSKSIIAKKPIDWIQFLAMRYVKMIVTFVMAWYLQCTITDYLKYPTLLGDAYKLKDSDELGFSLINLSFLRQNFEVEPNFKYIHLIGLWYS